MFESLLYTSRAQPSTDQWMALRLQSEIDSRRFEEIGYRPGLPATHFDAATVLGFMQARCADLGPP